MALGDLQDFEFVGGPCDGEVMSVKDPGDGYPEILVVDQTRRSDGGRETLRKEYRYERDGKRYRYLGEPLDT